jgi:hypothetical protein
MFMIAAAASESHPVLGALMAAGMIGGILVFVWLFTRFIPRKTSGWKALSQRFSATDVHKFGGRYTGCTGSFGYGRGSSIDGAFLSEFAQEGLLVTANFAKQTPILVPWPSIREVETVEIIFGRTDVIVTVDYEKRVRFHLPKDALAGLQQNVPAGRFREPTSLLGLVKDRLQQARSLRPPK